MVWPRRFWLKVQSLFRCNRNAQRLNDEIQFHLDQQISENLAAGMSRAEAIRRARIEFGGIEQAKEDCRDARWINFIENLLQDLRYSFRTLRKEPRFVLTVVFALAVGIGATTVVFSVIYNGLLRPFPYKDADRLTTFHIHDLQDADAQEAGRGDRGGFRSGELLTFQEQSRAFEGIIGFMNKQMSLSNGQGTLQINAALVTPSSFQFLGVNPLFGRSIVPADAKANQPLVFAMNYRMWQEHFNSDPDILGTSFGVGGESRTLVAIMPPRFQIDPEGSDIWIPRIPTLAIQE